jgi:hypothetical protein
MLRVGEAVDDAASLQVMGYSVALFPGVAVQAAGAAIDAAFAALSADPRLTDMDAQPDRIGSAAYLAGR